MDGVRKNRFNFRKDILVKQGYDREKSESKIMEERKIKKIFDCGSQIWKMEIKKTKTSILDNLINPWTKQC
jgi:hypothetical protein